MFSFNSLQKAPKLLCIQVQKQISFWLEYNEEKWLCYELDDNDDPLLSVSHIFTSFFSRVSKFPQGLTSSSPTLDGLDLMNYVDFISRAFTLFLLFPTLYSHISNPHNPPTYLFSQVSSNILSSFLLDNIKNENRLGKEISRVYIVLYIIHNIYIHKIFTTYIQFCILLAK